MYKNKYINRLENTNNTLIDIIETLVNKFPNLSGGYPPVINCDQQIPYESHIDTSSSISQSSSRHSTRPASPNHSISRPEQKSQTSPISCNLKLRNVFDDEFISNIYKNIIGVNVFVCSSQLPGNGGSATNAYNIYNMLCKLKIKSTCVFFENNCDESDIEKFNHFGLGGIHILPRTDVQNYVEKFEQIIDNSFGKLPDIFYCKNYTCPSAIKKLIQLSKYEDYTNVVYLVAGSRGFTDIINNKPMSFYSTELTKTARNVWFGDAEKKSVEDADYIFGNSMTCRDAYMVFANKQEMAKYKGQLYTSLITYELLKNNVNTQIKDIDVLFAVSNINRKIKNADYASKIFQSEKIKHLNKVIIGDYSFKYEDDEKNIKCYERVPNEEVMRYMMRAKVVINVSLFEACPNTCLEAIAFGCRVLCSKNCGGINEFIPKQDILGVDDEDIDMWCDRIIDVVQTEQEYSIPNMTQMFIKNIYRVAHVRASLYLSEIIENHMNVMSLNYWNSKYFLNKDINQKFLIADIMGIEDLRYQKQINKLVQYISDKKPELYDGIIVDTQIDDLSIYTNVGELKDIPGKCRKFLNSISENITICDISKISETDFGFVFLKKPTDEMLELIVEKKVVDISAFGTVV